VIEPGPLPALETAVNHIQQGS